MKRLALSEKDGKVVQLDLSRYHEPAALHESIRPIVRIHLLGSMRATSVLGADLLPRGKKARAVLGYLALAAGARVSRGRLAGMLWDRVPDDHARTSLRQALREISSAMGRLADELISTDRETITLNPNLCWIDAAAIFAPNVTSPASSRSDMAWLCTGDLLEDLDGTSSLFDQWLLGQRTRFSEQLRELLESELYELTKSKQDARKRVTLARHLISFDPTHEGASRALMRALSDTGERAQALREYSRCRSALRKTLDVEPSPETKALCEAIRSFSGQERHYKAKTASDAPPDHVAKYQPARHNRNRLRVAVLPFLASGSTTDKNLAFSLSQEIAAALARFRWFDVIALASQTRKPSNGDEGEFWRKQLDCDYLVDGTLLSNGKSLQISVRLLDITNFARPVWSDHFELSLDELHLLDERVTARIVGRIDPLILFIEGQPRRREHHGSTGLLMLAMPLMHSMERKKYEEAGEMINRALQIDPGSAMAFAWSALWQIYYVGQGWSNNTTDSFAIAQRHALQAMTLDPENAEALGIYGHLCSFLNKDFDSALHYFDRALRVNPNLAFVWALSALTYCYIGEPDIALQRLARHRDLAPVEPYPSVFDNPYAIAWVIKGEYERAATYGRRVTRARPEFVNGYKPLIAALGHLGRRDEAKPYIDKLLSLEPGFTVERFGHVYPMKHSRDRDHYMAGLRLAGVPER